MEVPNWECLCIVSNVCSCVYVDDIKLGGKKQNLVLLEEIDETH